MISENVAAVRYLSPNTVKWVILLQVQSIPPIAQRLVVIKIRLDIGDLLWHEHLLSGKLRCLFHPWVRQNLAQIKPTIRILF